MSGGRTRVDQKSSDEKMGICSSLSRMKVRDSNSPQDDCAEFRRRRRLSLSQSQSVNADDNDQERGHLVMGEGEWGEEALLSLTPTITPKLPQPLHSGSLSSQPLPPQPLPPNSLQARRNDGMTGSSPLSPHPTSRQLPNEANQMGSSQPKDQALPPHTNQQVAAPSTQPLATSGGVRSDMANNETASRQTQGNRRQTRRRLSISGVQCYDQHDFDDKVVERRGDMSNPAELGRMGLAYACKKGLKPESPNQDDFCIMRFDNWRLYGVFDGHGPFGHDISNYAQKSIARVLYNHPLFWTDPKSALKNAFRIVHNDLESGGADGNIDCSLSGTTATVILHFPLTNKLYIAHVGDSRAVLGHFTGQTTSLTATGHSTNKGSLAGLLSGPRGSPRRIGMSSRMGHFSASQQPQYNYRQQHSGNNGQLDAFCDQQVIMKNYKARDLTIDHKPDIRAERARIEANGGSVRRLDGDIGYRVFLQGLMLPGLAMSRAIGDTLCTQRAGVIPDPDVLEMTIGPNDDAFIVLCSDGVWEFITSQDAINICSPFVSGDSSQLHMAADALAAEAWLRWINEEENVVDDITALVVMLNA